MVNVSQVNGHDVEVQAGHCKEDRYEDYEKSPAWRGLLGVSEEVCSRELEYQRIDHDADQEG